MQRSKLWTIGTFVLTVGIGLGPFAGLLAAQKDVRVAKKTTSPPTLDGHMEDVWQEAPPLTVKVLGGRNLPGGTTEVTLRALYADDRLYLLVQYRDPTDGVRRSPWVKQADGTWQKLSDPSDKGGDNNRYYTAITKTRWR